MSRKRAKGGLFIWDEAQCFIDADGDVATSYTNDHITITFIQRPDGTLTDIAYETENTSGAVTIALKEEQNDD